MKIVVSLPPTIAPSIPKFFLFTIPEMVYNYGHSKAKSIRQPISLLRRQTYQEAGVWMRLWKPRYSDERRGFLLLA